MYELPGIDFASYRWGGTVDPITPGLTDRPYVARELVPWGSPQGADLLIAYERRLQEGWFEPSSLAPFARLISAGQVVTRNDLQYERYLTPRPRPTWATISTAPGLDPPVAYGPPTPNRSIAKLPLLDEQALGLPDNQPDAPPVASLGVPDAPPIVRTAPSAQPAPGRRQRRRARRPGRRRPARRPRAGPVRRQPRRPSRPPTGRARRRRPPRAHRLEPATGPAVERRERELGRHRGRR